MLPDDARPDANSVRPENNSEISNCNNNSGKELVGDAIYENWTGEHATFGMS